MQDLLSLFFFLIVRRPPKSKLSSSSAASDVYKKQAQKGGHGARNGKPWDPNIKKKMKK